MEKIISEVNNSYDFPHGIQIDETLQLKGGREVYTLVSDGRKYVLKIADKSKDEKGIERDTFIFSYLPQNGFENIPKLVPTRDQARYININGQFAYILEYVEGKRPPSNVATWTGLGCLAGKLHKVKDYPYKTPFMFGTEKAKLPAIAETLPFKDDYLKLVETLPNFDIFPQSLIHSDIGPHNSVQKPDGEIVFIDWDDASVGNRVLDIGFPLICQFVTEDLVYLEDEARAFYSAYAKENSITKQEKDAMFEASLFFALMYFPYGDIHKNWERTQLAISKRSEMEVMLNEIFK
jgi:Ser/Thr protein kinase RdoA (MazF antagonist)